MILKVLFFGHIANKKPSLAKDEFDNGFDQLQLNLIVHNNRNEQIIPPAFQTTRAITTQFAELQQCVFNI